VSRRSLQRVVRGRGWDPVQPVARLATRGAVGWPEEETYAFDGGSDDLGRRS
jgi:hypothetical protein